ncbi:MAG: lipopolysaccharide biosynthesis protein, partial [Streptosporangiaceae bacterium]
MTAQRLGQDDRERDEEFLARTMPLPAIDIAGYEPPAPADYREPPAEADDDDTAAPDRGTTGPDRGTTGLDRGKTWFDRSQTGLGRGWAAPDLGRAGLDRSKTGRFPGKAGAGLAGVARGGVINLAGAVISAASSVALTVIVTRNFSKSVVGTFFVAMSLFLIVEAVTNLGAYNGTIYFIARLRALNAERRIPAIIRATVIPVVITSLIGAAALVVFVNPLSKLLLAGQVTAPVRLGDLATMLRVLAVALPFAALADTMLGATRGFHEMQPTVIVDR